MRVVGIQSELVWHDPAANRAAFDRVLADVRADADVVVLPEMFTTGFTMAGLAQAEPFAQDAPTVRWLRRWAARLDAVICGSVDMAVDGSARNRLLWVAPDGHVETYDKRHLFRMAGEHESYVAGERRVIVEAGGLRVLLAVCYDLRFPVWARNRGDYDVYLVVANWPAARQQHWRTLLAARAIENQCFVIGVNRVGRDGNDVLYAGGSVVFDPRGEVLAERDDAPGTLEAELDGELLRTWRKQFPAWRDADAFDCG